MTDYFTRCFNTLPMVRKGDPPRMRWPVIIGYFRFTDPMERTQKCDKHPNITFWECWLSHFELRNIKAQAVKSMAGGRIWYAVYCQDFHLRVKNMEKR